MSKETIDGEVLWEEDDSGKRRKVKSERVDTDSNKSGGKGGKGGLGKTILNTAVPATMLVGKKAWDGGKKVGTAVVGKLRDPKFLVRRVLPGGMILGAVEMFDAIRSADPIIHNPPAEGRTKYLPVAGNGDIDSPHGDPNATVEALDAQIHKVNNDTWGFDPAKVWSYCDAGNCEGACIEIEYGPLEFDEEGATTPIKRWAEVVDEMYTTLQQYAGEMWADRLLQKYGQGGVAELQSLVDNTEDVAEALVAAVKASEEMGVGAYQALRHMIRAGREEMQGRVDDENSTYGWIGDAVFGGRGEGSLERLTEAGNKVTAAQQSNDDAIAKLKAALDSWDAKVAGSKDNTLAPTPVPLQANNHSGGMTDGTPEPLAPAGGGIPTPAAPSNPLPDDDDKPGFFDDLQDKLGGPLGGSENPFGSGMPLGSGAGSPLGGGMPMGSGAGTPPFERGMEPLSNAENPFEDEDKDKVLDEGEGGIEDEETDKPLDEGEGGFSEDDKADIVDTDADAPEVEELPEGDEAPVTAEATAAPAAAVNPNPNSPEARTVSLPDGRQIEFADARTADMVRNLVAADPSAPTTIDQAADAAGFTVPPMGQDIGQMVPPSAAMPGDVVVGEGGRGVYIGNGEVMMEDQSIKPLSEVSVFSGEHQGLFRLENPEGTMPADDPNAAPAQPVSADGGASAPVSGGGADTMPASTEGTGAPVTGATGMPDQTEFEPLSDDADAGLGGTTEEPLGLDPNAAAF